MEENSTTNQEITLKLLFKNPSLKLIEVLENNPDRCCLTLLGKVENLEKEETLVLRIKKKEFPLEVNLNELFENLNTLIDSPQQVFNNDIYFKLIAKDFHENKLKIDLIYPANQKVIDKYRKKGYSLFIETAAIYNERTLKFIENIDPSHTQWIQNILYKNAEKILHEEKDKFVLLQDYNTKDNENILNCLCIPYLDTIRSLRDLNETHLDLLEQIYNKGREVIAKLFNVGIDKVRCFVHYPPSFYYLHVHFLHVDYESHSVHINRAIDLHSVIQNIKLRGDYYRVVDMEINLQVGSKLYNVLNK